MAAMAIGLIPLTITGRTITTRTGRTAIMIGEHADIGTAAGAGMAVNVGTAAGAGIAVKTGTAAVAVGVVPEAAGPGMEDCVRGRTALSGAEAAVEAAAVDAAAEVAVAVRAGASLAGLSQSRGCNETGQTHYRKRVDSSIGRQHGSVCAWTRLLGRLGPAGIQLLFRASLWVSALLSALSLPALLLSANLPGSGASACLYRTQKKSVLRFPELVLLSRLRQLLPECNRMPGRLADCQALSGWPGAGLLVLLRRACRILSLCQAMLSALAAYHALSVFLDDFLHDRVIDT
jgi:hypothetical protein